MKALVYNKLELVHMKVPLRVERDQIGTNCNS